MKREASGPSHNGVLHPEKGGVIFYIKKIIFFDG